MKTKNNLKRIVVPEKFVQAIIEENHDHPSGGHLATEKLFYRISKRFWFRNTWTRVKEHYDTGPICDRNRKFFKKTDELHPIVVTEPLHTMEIDHVELPKSASGNNYVLTCVDHFSRKRWFIPVKSTSAVEAFQALFDNVFTNFDFPKVILSDRGTAFTSELAKEICKFADIEPTFAEPAQHNTMGSVERSNEAMKDIVRKFVSEWKQDDWDRYVRIAAYALNKSVNCSHSHVPDYLLFGLDKNTRYLDGTTTESRNIELVKLNKARNLANKILVGYREKISDLPVPVP
jgi:hypothetical protein